MANLSKMKIELASPAEYFLRLGDEDIALNPLLGKKIYLTYAGTINCIQCGRKTSKSFQQGYCFPCIRRLQECDNCVIHPERCHVQHGDCPTDDWAHAQCHQAHIVYLANSSNLKVGITRHTQVPTRWLDQGAMQALPIFRVANRYQAGVVEVALKRYVNDKTNWRTMLKQKAEPMDLQKERDRLLIEADNDIANVIQEFAADVEQLAEEVVSIEYPVNEYPQKITSLSLDKTPEVSGVLQGMKGQYLILDTGVINIRKFGGYDVECRVD